MYQIVGFQRKKGDYNGTAYDNMIIHCIKDADSEKEEEGQMVETIKVKFALFDSLDVAIGDVISVYYDRFGRVCQIISD